MNIGRNHDAIKRSHIMNRKACHEPCSALDIPALPQESLRDGTTVHNRHAALLLQRTGRGIVVKTNQRAEWRAVEPLWRKAGHYRGRVTTCVRLPRGLRRDRSAP